MCQENISDKEVQLITIESPPKNIKKECKGNCSKEGVDIEAQKKKCHGDKVEEAK